MSDEKLAQFEALFNQVATKGQAGVTEALNQLRAMGGKVGRKPRLDVSVLQTALDSVLAEGPLSVQGAAQEVWFKVRPDHPELPGVAQIANLIKSGSLKGSFKTREKRVVASVPSADVVVTETSVTPVTVETTPAGEVVNPNPSEVVTQKGKKSKVKTA